MSDPAGQAEIVAWLRSLARSDPIETHISLVFVGTDTVWKLKKAVRLPFVDFSPPEQRRRFALRELELNSAAAPGMYRDVVPVIRGSDQRLAFGEGAEAPEALDWVLRMARVPAADFLDRIAEAGGGLAPALQDAVADAVAAFAVLREAACTSPGACDWIALDARDAATALERAREAVRGRASLC